MIWRRDEQPAQQPAEPAREEPREPRPERHERHEGRRRMAENDEVTIVGQGASLEGNIMSAGSLRIDGKVKGQVSADGDVIVSPQSQVEADIKAENVSVAGRFKGNITVSGKVELSRGGRVDGNITSKVLVVQEGGIFQGQSIMDQQAQATSHASSAAAKPATTATAGQASGGTAGAEADKAKV